MNSYYINPKEKTIKGIVLYHKLGEGISNLRETIKLILEVDIVEKMWYNKYYSLYYQAQDTLAQQKEVHWFEITGEKETKVIFGSAIIVPNAWKDDAFLKIEFLDEYEPPLHDFVL